jgi:hypothetical protein
MTDYLNFLLSNQQYNKYISVDVLCNSPDVILALKHYCNLLTSFKDVDFTIDDDTNSLCGDEDDNMEILLLSNDELACTFYDGILKFTDI